MSLFEETRKRSFDRVWFIVMFKNQYVTWFLEQRARRSPTLLQNSKRMILPLSEILSWMIIGFGIIISAALAGVDIRPLLTVGGVSGIVVGLSAQSVLANMIAGINLVPFRRQRNVFGCVFSFCLGPLWMGIVCKSLVRQVP